MSGCEVVVIARNRAAHRTDGIATAAGTPPQLVASELRGAFQSLRTGY